MFPCLLEDDRQRPYTGTAARGSKVLQLLDLVLAQVGRDHERYKGVDDTVLCRAFQDRAHGVAIEPQFVGGAAMRETVYPHRTVGSAHDARLAAAVLGTLERIGERFRFVPSGIIKY